MQHSDKKNHRSLVENGKFGKNKSYQGNHATSLALKMHPSAAILGWHLAGLPNSPKTKIINGIMVVLPQRLHVSR